jgi:hypothetical protein
MILSAVLMRKQLERGGEEERREWIMISPLTEL